MIRFLRPLRRTFALAMGLLLLQAFLAPGDLACALRHHAGEGGSEAAQAPPTTHEGHAAHTAPASEESPVPGDHCDDPARGHCAWMSACAPVAHMVAAGEPARDVAIREDLPAARPLEVLRGVARAPDVPPPRA